MRNLLDWTRRHSGWVFTLLLLLFAVLVFREVLSPGQVIMTTDDNVGSLALRKQALPGAFLGGWDDSILVGTTMNLSLNWTYLLLWLLPLFFFANWIHLIDLVIASMFLFAFFRQRKLSLPAAWLGVLTAFWLGSNFTLTYAGHIGKFGVLLFAAAFLYLSDQAVRRRSALWSVLAGGALGGMFLEQADVALFFAIFLVPLALFFLWQEEGWTRISFFRVSFPMLFVALLLAARPLLVGYTENVADAAAVQEDSKQKWEFITQWSWPPEETIEFVLPGFMGWRSGDPDGPYRGRMGRSAGWKETGQGFRNFKLENQYVGWIPVLLGLLAVVAAWSRRKLEAESRWILVCALAGGISLLLAFGKFTPVYFLFYQLPVVSEIRNPNKFLQVWQLLAGVLAAFGLQKVIQRESSLERTWVMRVLWALAAVMVFSYFVSLMNSQSLISRFVDQGWGGAADRLVRLRSTAIGHGTLLAAAFAVILLLSRKGGAWSRLWILLPILVAFDAVWLSRHYIETMDPALLERNPVVEILDTEPGRPYLIQQDSFYGNWLTFTFPYYGIDTFNFTQYPRMPEDYKQFLQLMSRNPILLWQLSGIGPILAPGGFWGQIQSTPEWKDRFDLLYAYHVVSSERGMAARIVPVVPGRPGDQCVLRFKGPSDRFRLVSDWQYVPTDQQLAELTQPGFRPLEKILLDPSVRDTVGEAPGGLTANTVTVTQFRSNRMDLKVSAEKTCILRMAEKYAPGWKARVNGKEVPVLRCDFLFRGVKVPAGLSQVELFYTSPMSLLYVQILGLALIALAGGLAFLRRDRPGRATLETT